MYYHNPPHLYYDFVVEQDVLFPRTYQAHSTYSFISVLTDLEWIKFYQISRCIFQYFPDNIVTSSYCCWVVYNITFFDVKACKRGSLINCQNLIGPRNSVINEHSMVFISVEILSHGIALEMRMSERFKGWWWWLGGGLS